MSVAATPSRKAEQISVGLGEMGSGDDHYFLTEYRWHLVYTVGLRTLSVASYLSDLRLFVDAMRTRGRGHIARVTWEDITVFLQQPRSLKENGGKEDFNGHGHVNSTKKRATPPLQAYKNSSLARRIASLRSYFTFLYEQKYLSTPFATWLESPRVEQGTPLVLTQGIIKAFFAAFPTVTPLDKRDKLLFRYMYALGLRISEVQNVVVSDLQLTEGFLTIHGKGGKNRLVPLLAQLVTETQVYLQNVHNRFYAPRREGGGAPADPTSTGRSHKNYPTASGETISSGGGAKKFLFPSRQGKPLSRVMVWKIVKKRLKNAGMASAITPHTFRHSCATHLLQNGADLRLVQELLGHAHIQTTEIYTHIMRQDLKQAAKRYHPFYYK